MTTVNIDRENKKIYLELQKPILGMKKDKNTKQFEIQNSASPSTNCTNSTTTSPGKNPVSNGTPPAATPKSSKAKYNLRNKSNEEAPIDQTPSDAAATASTGGGTPSASVNAREPQLATNNHQQTNCQSETGTASSPVNEEQ